MIQNDYTNPPLGVAVWIGTFFAQVVKLIFSTTQNDTPRLGSTNPHILIILICHIKSTHYHLSGFISPHTTHKYTPPSFYKKTPPTYPKSQDGGQEGGAGSVLFIGVEPKPHPQNDTVYLPLFRL